MEAAEEEIVCIETNIFGNVGLTSYVEPLKRPAQTVGQARPSNILRLGSD